jgi:hypothetical protein
MALAISVQMLKYAWLPEYRVTQEPGPGTMGWMEKRMYDDDFSLGSPGRRVRVRRPIGQFTLRAPDR